MFDLELAIKEFKKADYTLVVAKDKKILFTSRLSGIFPLLQAYQQLENKMKGTAIADKVIGKAAALLSIYFKISALYTPLLSGGAKEVLEKSQTLYRAEKIVPYIRDSEGKAPCPLEKITEKLEDPQTAYLLISRRFQEGVGK